MEFHKPLRRPFTTSDRGIIGLSKKMCVCACSSIRYSSKCANSIFMYVLSALYRSRLSLLIHNIYICKIKNKKNTEKLCMFPLFCCPKKMSVWHYLNGLNPKWEIIKTAVTTQVSYIKVYKTKHLSCRYKTWLGYINLLLSIWQQEDA